MLEEHVQEMLMSDEPMPEEPISQERMLEALMAALRLEEEQMDDIPMEEAQTTEEPATEAQVGEPQMLGEPMEEEPAETPDTRRRLSRRPPRWQQSTAAQSRLQRALHIRKLERQLEEYELNREEIQEFAPLETRIFLRGARPAPPMDAAAQAEERADGEELDSAKVNSLYVPENRLQVAQFNESIRNRDFYETVTREEMISITMPTAYETWKMEKEHLDLQDALEVYTQTTGQDERERDHRIAMWSRSRGYRIDLFRSRGYGSSFREVISADEDWPEEDWASAGLEQPDAPFLVRFEAKMRTRPVLVPNKATEPC